MLAQVYKKNTRERKNSMDGVSLSSRPQLTVRLRALCALEARGAIDATQKGALKEALLANSDEKLNETLDRFSAANDLVVAQSGQASSLAKSLSRGRSNSHSNSHILREAAPGEDVNVESLGADLENLMSLDNLDRRSSFDGRRKSYSGRT